MSLVAVGLGSNIEAEKNIHVGAQALRRKFPDVKFSSVYQTRAVGMPEGTTDFLNACAVFRSDLAHFQIFQELHTIEEEAGRERASKGYQSYLDRTLDLDLLLVGENVSDSLEFSLPHPQVLTEAFVLVPLCELIPEVLHPKSRRPLSEHLAELSYDPTGIELCPNLTL